MQTSEITSARLRDLLCAALLLSFALTIAYPRWRAGMDWRDEGLLAYGAVRVMHGDVPQRDFVSLQPPLSFYIVAGIFKLCGTSLLSLRGFGSSIFLLLPLLIYGAGRNFMTPVLSFAAAVPACILGLPYCNFVPLAVWQGIAASLAAVLFFLPAVFSTRQWLAFPAGVLTAVSLALRHDQAVYTMASIVALTVVLALARGDSVSETNLKRALLLWLTGLAIVLVPAIVAWWSVGALPEMFRQLILFPLTTYRKPVHCRSRDLLCGIPSGKVPSYSCFTSHRLFRRSPRCMWCDLLSPPVWPVRSFTHLPRRLVGSVLSSSPYSIRLHSPGDSITAVFSSDGVRLVNRAPKIRQPSSDQPHLVRGRRQQMSNWRWIAAACESSMRTSSPISFNAYRPAFRRIARYWCCRTSQCFIFFANGETRRAGTICGQAIRPRKIMNA
jgi:hypothetical protein